MKSTHIHRKSVTFISLALILALSLSALPAAAATFTWNSSGTGTWDVSSTNWNGATGTPLWDSFDGISNIADFATSGATASIGGSPAAVYANGIRFDNTAAISGGTINLAGTTPAVTVNATGGTTGSVLAGAAGLIKSGSGLLSLTAAEIYSGTTTISAGTLGLAAGGSLVASGSVSFSANSTFDIGANSQSLATVAVAANGVTGIVAGNGGTLTLTGSFALAPNASSTSRNLNLSGLSSFVYNNSANIFRVDGNSLSNQSSATATLTLATASSITAASFYVGQTAQNTGGSGNDSAIVNLGQNTTIDANSILLGLYHDAGTLHYGSATNNPILTIRGTNGGSTRADMTLGSQNYTNNDAQGTVDLVTNVTGTSTLDAMLGTLGIGISNRGANSGTKYNVAGVFSMGAGTLDATTIMLGQLATGSSASVTGSTITGTFTSGAGGTIKAQNVYLGDSNVFGGSAQAATATFNLNGGATLLAQNIANGPDTGTVGTFTRNFNWNNGTIANYNTSGSTTNLTVSVPSLTLAATGTHTFWIDAAQTGTVTSAIGGAGALTKNGPGSLAINGSSNYAGGTNILSGTLQLGNSAALGSGTLMVNGGVLDINGQNAATGAVTLASGSIINSGAAAAFNAAGYKLQGGTASAVLGGAAAPLTMNGPGTALLTAANTYGGLTTITAGTLALGASGTVGSGGVTIAPGGVWDVSAYNSAGGYNFSAGTLTAGRTAAAATDVNGSLNVNAAVLAQSASNSTMTISGNLSLNGATINYLQGDQINLAGGGALNLSGIDFVYIPPTVPVATGAYTLITAASISGGTANLAASGGSPRQQYVLGTSGGTAVTMTVTGSAANLQWNGGVNSTWVFGVSPNWLNASGGSLDYFYSGDNVTFNDTPGTATNVNVSGTVQPGSLLVSNTTVNYTFGGSGVIAGNTALIKNGPGGLTINNSNTYAGGTSLNGGVLTANGAAALGSSTIAVNAGLLNLGSPGALGSAAVTISGGSLDNTSGGSMSLVNNSAQNWSGSFTFIGSSPLNTGSVAIALGTTPTVTVSSSTLTVGGSISGGNGFVKAGSGTLNLAGANTYAGDTAIALGTLQVGMTGAIPTGATAGNVVFTSAANSAVLDLNGLNVTLNGLSQANPSTTNMVVNNLSGTSTLSVGNNNATSTFAGVLADNTGSGGILALRKTGAGVLTLGGSIAYSGGTTINGGTLALATGTNLPTSSTVSFTSTGTLNIGNNSQTLGTITVIDGAAGAIAGSGGALTLAGSGFALSPTTLNTTTVLDMSKLSKFTFNNPAANFVVYPNSTATSTLAIAAVMTLAQTNLITANNLQVTGEDHSSVAPPSAIMYLGETNVINANQLAVGAGTSASGTVAADAGGGTLQFAAGLVNPTLTIRAADGVSPANINVGCIASGGQGFTRTSVFDVSAGVLDASVATMNIAYNLRNSLTTPTTASFLMGSGTLNAAAINIANDTPQSGSNGAEPINGTFTVSGGVVKVNTLTLGNQFFNTLSGTFNLNSGSTLYAQSIQAGAGSATRTFNWNDGTIHNYDANTSLTIGAGPSLILSATGSHTFAIDAGQSATVNAVLSGSGGLNVAGPGLVILAASNTYTGPTAISGGTLQIDIGGTSGALSASSTIANNGTLAFNRSDTASQGTDFSGSPITGNGGLVQMGPGTLILGANAYSGPTVVAGGKLYVNGSAATSGITVANGATLGGSGSLASASATVNAGTVEGGFNGAGSLTLGGLTFVGGGAVNASNVAVFPSSGTAAAINVAGTLTTDATPISVTIGGSLPLTSGTAHIIKYSGAIAGSGYNFTLASPLNTPRNSFSLANDAGYVDFIYHIDYPYWAGAGDHTWNTSSTNNWNLNSNNSATAYIDGDYVIFDDRAITYSGNASQTVTIDQGSVSPQAVTFSNTAASYTLQGSSGITGTTGLTVNGGGSVTIANANSYTGVTALSSGVLNLTAIQAIGSGPLTISGGTLNANAMQFPSSVAISGGLLNMADPGALGSGTLTIGGGTLGNTSGADLTLNGGNPQVWNGNFAYAGSNVLNLGTGAVSMNASPTITVVGTGSLVVGGPISGVGGLTKNGPGGLILTDAGSIPTSGSNYSGNVTVSGGTLVAAAEASGNNTVLGNGSNSRTVTVGPGAVLEFIVPNATATGFNKTNIPTLAISGGTVTNAEPGAPFPAGQINNPLNNVTLTDGVLTATTGQQGGYAAWNVNGTITSSGNSLISTSDPVYGSVMLNSSGGSAGTTTVNVSSGTLTISAPLVQDSVDNIVDALRMTGAGTLVLSGTNTYTGGTIVNSGTLIAANNEAIADGTSLTVGNALAFPTPVVPAPVAAPAVSPVPEPGTVALLVAAASIAVGWSRLRREKTKN